MHFFLIFLMSYDSFREETKGFSLMVKHDLKIVGELFWASAWYFHTDLLSRCLFPTGTILLNGVVSDQVRFPRPSLGLRLNEKPWGIRLCVTVPQTCWVLI